MPADDGTLFDIADLDGLRRGRREGAALVVVETLSNPNLAVADLPAICEVAHAAGADVLVDNTVATPVNCRPLEWGADMVMHSATKYLNGHSDVLAGVAAGPECADAPRSRAAALDLGATLSPDSAWLVRRGIRTLHLRGRAGRPERDADREFLEAHPRVQRVVYPGPRIAPAHDVAQRILDGFGAMLAFERRGRAGRRARPRWTACACACGRPASAASRPASRTRRRPATASSREAELEAAGILPGDLRLAVGIEDADDLIEDLDAGASVTPERRGVAVVDAPPGAPVRPELRRRADVRTPATASNAVYDLPS